MCQIFKRKGIRIRSLFQRNKNAIISHLEPQTEKIKWVVTVPAIWNEHQKSVMMEACIGAGLVIKYSDKSLFFALEPEAASLYCSINKEIILYKKK